MNYINSSDGILTALKVIETIKKSGNILLETFNKYPQINITVDIKNRDKALINDFIKSEYFQNIKKIYIKDKVRIIVRISGTEPVIRIMVEGFNNDEIYCISQKIKNEIIDFINR
jgi:phosphoglucosamine mutase